MATAPNPTGNPGSPGEPPLQAQDLLEGPELLRIHVSGASASHTTRAPWSRGRARRPFFLGLSAPQSHLLLFAGLVLLFLAACRPTSKSDEFIRLMNVGKNYLDKGESEKAAAAFEAAVKLNPTHPDAHLNLANAFLLVGEKDPNQTARALQHAQQVLALEPSSPAAHYLAGCAQLRLRRFEEALKELQTARDIDPTVSAVTFQLARAHQELGHLEDAINAYGELVQFEPEHPAAHYALSQVLLRAGRREEADQSLKRHRDIQEKKPSMSTGLSAYERCVYTQARAPFQIEQPDPRGIPIRFVDDTANALGSAAARFQGPFGVIDPSNAGRNSLFAREGAAAFRLLLNTNGTFQPFGPSLPVDPASRYSRCLVGDLQNDRYDDIVVLGDRGSYLFRFATNMHVSDATALSKMNQLTAVDGALVDLDFTGKLDLLTLSAGGQQLRVLRNLGNLYFQDITTTSGLPSTVVGAKQLGLDDWNNDDLLDLFIARTGEPPATLFKLRGGPLALTNSIQGLPPSDALALGDVNNDLRTDLIIATPAGLEIVLNSMPEHLRVPGSAGSYSKLRLIDYDNDGWLDIWAYGQNVRVWRNRSLTGWTETTESLGLSRLPQGRIEDLAAADFDNDGDTDIAIAIDGQGLRYFRNEGGQVNQQVKLKLIGNRSNSSGIGIRLELAAGGLRLLRTANQLPLEIGVGKHQQLDALTVRWFDLALSSVDVKVEPQSQIPLIELQLPTGSCPYLYAWDGHRFRFVTDILGAAPMGLPAAAGVFIDADAQELVWVGDESLFQPRQGHYTLKITEELREVLFLDEVRLVVVDHPAGTEVHPTSKLVPRKPFPPADLAVLHELIPLREAKRHDGLDATPLLREIDNRRVSPVQQRIPQLRGLAEPFSVELAYDELPVDQPLVLALTGWLRFGGGMANIAASHNPDLPFPFPTLEAQDQSGRWRSIDVTIGAPAGKTKTILADLTGKLPARCQRLRLTTAFEIHWDRIALFVKADSSQSTVTRLEPDSADLHWHGFGEFEDLPWDYPLTPSYDRVDHTPPWRVIPTGWCTRYGDVKELVLKRDDALALINAGDELTLSFAASRLPPLPAGHVRDFFLYTVGWEKDSDFHVTLGYQVEPLPFHGMDDQLYGRQTRPVIEGDWWIKKYNTRWVGPSSLKRDYARR